jgi:archaellin
VSNGVQVVEVVGLVEDVDPPTGITAINILVSLSPGSDPVDTKQLSIETVGPSGEDFIDVSATTRTGNADDSDVLSEPGEKVELQIAKPLSEGQTLEITITTGDGAQTFVTATVPEPLTSDDQNGAVRL